MFRTWSRQIVNGMILGTVSVCRGTQDCWGGGDLQDPSSENDYHEDFLGSWHLDSPYKVRWKDNDSHICKDVEESYGIPESNLEHKSIPL